MNKVIPVANLIMVIFAVLFSLASMLIAFFAQRVTMLPIIAVIFLVLSCVLNAITLVPSIIFKKSKLCRAATIVAIFAYAFTVVGFIVLYAGGL